MIPSTDENKGNNAFRNALNLLSAEGLDGAMMVVERELEKNPESWEAFGAKADILYLREMYGSALQSCEKSIKLNPNNAFAWNTKGNALYKLGRYEEAIFCYNQAIEIEPLFVRAWHNKKLALEIQITKSTRKISLSNIRSQDMRSGSRFTR
jgi:tetratricopeptide (TPR) repeat protein